MVYTPGMELGYTFTAYASGGRSGQGSGYIECGSSSSRRLGIGQGSRSRIDIYAPASGSSTAPNNHRFTIFCCHDRPSGQV